MPETDDEDVKGTGQLPGISAGCVQGDWASEPHVTEKAKPDMIIHSC